MYSQAKRIPGLIYHKGPSFKVENILSDHQNVNSEHFSLVSHSNHSEYDDDGIDEYFQTIKDSEEQKALTIKKTNITGKTQKSLSLPQSPKSCILPDLKVFEAGQIYWANYSHLQHNQKQSNKVHKHSNSKDLNSKKLNPILSKIKIIKNPQEDLQSSDNIDFDNPPILPAQKQLAQPYFQYTYVQEPKVAFVDQQVKLKQEQPFQSKKPTVNLQKPEQIQGFIKIFFKNEYYEKNYDDFGLIDKYLKFFEPYTLVDFLSNDIFSSIPKLMKEILLLKNLENFINFTSKKDKINQIKGSTFSDKILCEVRFVAQQINKTSTYEGLDGLFTTNKKIQQIKRFLVFERMFIVIIVYLTIIGKFEQYKSYLINLLRFLIQNHLILLNNTINSKALSFIIHQYYPQLNKKSLDLIKVNNDSINQVILKLSVVDDLFFSSLNKLGKRTANFSYGQILKEFLEFLAFYLHKNGLETKGCTFETCPAPFLKLNHQKYYLVIDATSFSIKDKKGAYSFRPFHQNFLKQMSNHFQLINYSYLSPKQSKNLLQKLDKNNLIKHNLFSHHFEAWPSNKRCVQKICPQAKNLLYLNCEQNQQENNGKSIQIRKWKGDKKDKELVDIVPLLITVPYMKLDCQSVAKRMQNCLGDIGKMQQQLLALLKEQKFK